MKRNVKYLKGKIEKNNVKRDISLMDKLRNIMITGEGITQDAPKITTEKKDGVQPAYDVRSDFRQIAEDAMGKAHNRDINKWINRDSNGTKDSKKDSEKVDDNQVVS